MPHTGKIWPPSVGQHTPYIVKIYLKILLKHQENILKTKENHSKNFLQGHLGPFFRDSEGRTEGHGGPFEGHGGPFEGQEGHLRDREGRLRDRRAI